MDRLEWFARHCSIPGNEKEFRIETGASLHGVLVDSVGRPKSRLSAAKSSDFCELRNYVPLAFNLSPPVARGMQAATGLLGTARMRSACVTCMMCSSWLSATS